VNLNGKLAIVTGGSSGIGLALARQLTEMGAQVVLVARDAERLEAARGSLKPVEAGSHLAFSADIRDVEQVKRMAEQVLEQVGVPDLLINNAGAAHPGYVHELGLDIYHWLMDVNYWGALYVTRAFLPGMMERRSGQIVNVVSTAGFAGVFSYTAYSASKFALRGFSESLRAEMKPYCITVSLVYPSDTDTPQLAYEDQYKPAELVEMLSAISFSPYPPEVVAERILKGVEKKKQIIITDAGNKALYAIVHYLNLAYPVQDFLLNRALKKLGKRKSCPEKAS
jgi:3-dehydrosphinganine reductase